MPYVESDDPKRVMLLIDSTLPRKNVSKTEAQLPTRHLLITLHVLPILVNFLHDIDDPRII
jgi:hypothetical protein